MIRALMHTVRPRLRRLSLFDITCELKRHIKIVMDSASCYQPIQSFTVTVNRRILCYLHHIQTGAIVSYGSYRNRHINEINNLNMNESINDISFVEKSAVLN